MWAGIIEVSQIYLLLYYRLALSRYFIYTVYFETRTTENKNIAFK